MRIYRTLGVTARLLPLLAAYALAPPAAEAKTPSTTASPRVLTVELYPFIPDALHAYLRLEEAFEAQHPEIHLNIKIDPNYYSHTKDAPGILGTTGVQVYEVDSVFLRDFKDQGKLEAPGLGLDAEARALLPVARSAATLDHVLVGIPHWLCGNFLIYRPSRVDMSQVRSLADVAKALAAGPGDHLLLMDLKGRSTLGEIYLDAAMDRLGDKGKAAALVASNILDPDILNDVRRVSALEPPNQGRSSLFHGLEGYYEHYFGEGTGSAFVGYSESTSYALQEAGPELAKDLAVVDWPMDDAGAHAIAWADTLVMAPGMPAQQKADAETFIRFMVSPDAYDIFLMPAKGDVPRFLMPARADVFDSVTSRLIADPAQHDAGLLYPQFRRIIEHATPVVALCLNDQLRQVAGQLDKALDGKTVAPTQPITQCRTLN